jgi:hypothetical protein
MNLSCVPHDGEFVGYNEQTILTQQSAQLMGSDRLSSSRVSIDVVLSY